MKSILAMLAFKVPEGWGPMKATIAMFAFQVFLIAVVVAGLMTLAGCASNSECLKCPGQCDLQRLICPKGEVK